MKFEKYKLQSGKVKWRFYHYLGINPDTGKADEIERRGFNTQGDARSALLEIIREYEEGQKITNLKNNRFNFKKVSDLWLIHYKKQVRVTTYVTTEGLIRNHILTHFEDYFIDRIDVFKCQDAVNLWYETFTEASLLVSITSRIFKFGINQGFCRENPMSKIIRPKNTHKKKYNAPFYEKHELLEFLKILKDKESVKAHTIFHVLAFTGLRRGELFGLKWKDINFKRKTISVERTLIYNEIKKEFEFGPPKTENGIREIGIDDNTIQILLKWRNHQREFFLGRGINVGSKEQSVFTSQTNHYMTDTFLRRVIKRVTTRNDLGHITIHGFRHTHCSLLFDAGIGMNDVKDRLGHSDIKVTLNIYAHVTKESRSKTADIFNDYMQEGL